MCADAKEDFEFKEVLIKRNHPDDKKEPKPTKKDLANS
jgi:hypothetical protein